MEGVQEKEGTGSLTHKGIGQLRGKPVYKTSESRPSVLRFPAKSCALVAVKVFCYMRWSDAKRNHQHKNGYNSLLCKERN